jgi:uncharacterized protein (TIGR03435 family)
MIRATLILAVVGGVALMSAQAPEQSAPAFEVSSVKPVSPGVADLRATRPRNRLGTFLPGGHFVAQNAVLGVIIKRAYPEYTTLIGPDWIDQERFTIEARAEGDPSLGQLRVMLRQLLADRFQLRVRPERRPAEGYALVYARADRQLGSGLRRATTNCATLSGAPVATRRRNLPPCSRRVDVEHGLTEASIRGGTMLTLTNLLRGATGTPIEDRTGLSGSFDIDLDWNRDQPLAASAEPDFRQSIFTSVEEQLGLKLESTRGSVDVLVIDSVERPTPD